MTNIYLKWCLSIAFLIAAITIVVDAKNKIEEISTTELPTQYSDAQYETEETATTELPTVAAIKIILVNESCLPAQTELVLNCSIDFEDEIKNFSNETLDSTTESTTESTAPPDDLGSIEGNVSTIIEYLQREPNMTRHALDHVCTAVGNIIKCIDARIRDTECNPVTYRFYKVFQKEFCNPTFLEIFLESSACVFNAALQPKIVSCVKRLKDTYWDFNTDVLNGDSSYGEAMCKSINLVYGCFSSSVESCSLELLNQSADIGGKFITAMYDYKCEVKKSMESDVEVVEG